MESANKIVLNAHGWIIVGLEGRLPTSYTTSVPFVAACSAVQDQRVPSVRLRNASDVIFPVVADRIFLEPYEYSWIHIRKGVWFEE